MKLTSIRYVGFYSGPSYGNPWGPDHPTLAREADAFTSIRQAKEWFRERQETSGRYPLTTHSAKFAGGNIVSVAQEEALWPATTPEDKLELYPVYIDDGGDIRASHEPSIRITAGPRGGAVAESFV